MRPQPPEALCDDLRHPLAFAPAYDLAEWIRSTYLDPRGSLYNPEHEHLQQATLACLWTNVPNTRQGNIVAATCEMPKPTQGNKWQKARLEYQLYEWFGGMPDFLFTFDAVICALAADAPFCSTVDHELYHAGQQRDEYGSPKFTRDGQPKFCLKGHDVEEHLGVIRRWGARGVLNPNVRELVELAAQFPEVSPGGVLLACGTCGRMAA